MSETSIDNKLVKKHYPNTNNDQELSFIFEADPNLCMLKNKIAIHFIIELDDKYLPDNGFAAKQFSNIYVELNSQKISNNKTTGEYWLNDWMLKYGNLNPDYVTSVYEIEGYYDKYAYDFLHAMTKRGYRYGVFWSPSDPVHIDDGLNLNDMNKWNRLFNEIQPKCNNLDV